MICIVVFKNEENFIEVFRFLVFFEKWKVLVFLGLYLVVLVLVELVIAVLGRRDWVFRVS